MKTHQDLATANFAKLSFASLDSAWQAPAVVTGSAARRPRGISCLTSVQSMRLTPSPRRTASPGLGHLGLTGD